MQSAGRQEPEEGLRYGIQVNASGIIPGVGIMYYDGKCKFTAYPQVPYATYQEALNVLQSRQQEHVVFNGSMVRIVEIKYEVQDCGIRS